MTKAGSPAIEFKKFFMDEWSGTVDAKIRDEIGHALQSTLPGLRAEPAKVTK